LHAMASPLIGHLDPAFLQMMNDIQESLRGLFRTRNRFTIAISGTGSAGMEAVLVNLLEPGEPVLVGVNGAFGERMAAIVDRCGARPIRLEAEWGRIIDPSQVEEALRRHGPVRAVTVVHAETSTGVRQPLEEISALCRQHDALFIVDAVTSLGGLALEIDAWGIDACYGGTQKCLSCPPGLSPVTLNERAMAVIRKRKRPCQSWYLDFGLIADYWEEAKRVYHHTAPISMLYALREALCLIEEEGLNARFARHHRNSAALMGGLQTLGLAQFAQEGYRLPTLNCVRLSSQIDDRRVRSELLNDFGIEIGGGLGPLHGKVWRIGLMGESSTAAHVLTLLQALEQIFKRYGWLDRPGTAVQRAAEVFAEDRAQGKREDDKQ
jgi:alanine-glyoxylate transaminase / serine-glyoxylate transaminase / serine-pyruvate transaminase